MLVGGAVVGDGVDDFCGWRGPLDGVAEANEFLMPMLLHAAPEDGSIQDIEGGKERCRAGALLVMCHCSAFARLERQARSRAVERLNLAFFIYGDDNGVSGRIHGKADDVFELLGKFGIAGAFERAQAMRLKAMSVPPALDGAKRDVEFLGHCPSGPVGARARRSEQVNS